MTITTTTEWRTRAACRDVDADVFFPTAETGPVYEAQVAVAKAVCARCPVRAECLDEALVMCTSARKRCFEQGIRVEDMSFSWPVAAPPWSFCVLDTSGPDVHDGPGRSAGTTSTTSKTCPAEIHITLARIPYGIAGGLTPDERRHAHAGRRRDTDNPAAQAAAVAEAGLRPGARPREVREAGRVLLAAGRPVREVAARCGVAERTAARWATTTSTVGSDVPAAVGGAGKGRGCSRALPLISHNTALAGTRATEGPRA